MRSQSLRIQRGFSRGFFEFSVDFHLGKKKRVFGLGRRIAQDENGHELTGMWVPAALGCGCSQRHAQMYWLTSYIKMARCQALGPVKICTTLLLHSSKTTAHCCSPRGYQPRAGRRCPFALFELCQCGRICAEIFRALLGHAMIGAGTAGRAPVAVFKAGRLRIW